MKEETVIFSIGFIIFLISFEVNAQTNAELISVQLEATIQNSPAEISLNWLNDSSGTAFTVYRRHKVSFVWVKGHADNKENERCDVLAVQAAEGKNLQIDRWYENNVKNSEGSLF